MSSHHARDHRGPTPRRIRVLLVDDHTLVRLGMRSILENEPDLEVVGEAADGAAAVSIAGAVRPDVILMDVSMPKVDGVDATRRIGRLLPTSRVIGLSMHSEPHYAQAMREAGAVAYINKCCDARTLCELIRRASRTNEALEPFSL